MNHVHGRDQRPPIPSAGPPQPQACAAGQHSSPSVMSNIGTVHMTEPQYTLHSQVHTGPAVNITVTGLDHSQETQRSGPTPPHTMVIHDGPTRSDQEIYHYQLLSKGRGYPLWIPGPGRELPVEYRKTGISIGDVGIINQLGLFDFLFNIFQPANSPIHSRGVPPSFSPKDPRGLEDITNNVYGHNTYLTSESDLKFESSAQEAAILTMPEGALTRDLLNKGIIQRCIEENAKDWYEYAIGPRGRIIEQGEILGVVIGWDKVRSWGIATSTCTSDQSVSLEFKVGDESGTSRAYRWDCTGSANVRVGPQAEEMSDLRQTNGVFPQNQCIFVRTMNFTIAETLSDDRPSTAVPVSEGVKGLAANHESSKGGPKGQRGGWRSWFGGRSSSGQGASQTRQCVAIDCPRESGVVHPSSWLHEHLLKKYPNATLVITEDTAWTFVLTEEDKGFPKPEALISRVLEAHEVHNNGGIVQLSPRLPFARKRANTDGSKRLRSLSGDMAHSGFSIDWGCKAEEELLRTLIDMQQPDWEERTRDSRDQRRREQKEEQARLAEKRIREEERQRRREEKRIWDDHYKWKEQHVDWNTGQNGGRNGQKR